ncbi:hypothetical protein A2333_01160 [Candidatus Wolfebacteria bacterium RIFOXYB2_FULL_49_7]|nr:MAG: hypothetical protein A2333_01160 [Candidatus Wolfebacteria bacterium RIFOXYB2_FULL_49_7]
MMRAIYDSKELSVVWDNLRNKQRVIRGATVAVIASIIAAVLPYLYGRLADIALDAQASIALMATLVVLWLVLSIVRDWMDRSSIFTAEEISVELYDDLTVEFMMHVVRLPLEFHKSKKVGKVMSQVARGVDDISDLFRDMFTFLPAIISFVVANVILLLVEWRLSVILSVACATYVAVTLKYTERIGREQKRMRKYRNAAHGELHEAIMNVEAIKATTNERFENTRLRKKFRKATDLYMRHLAIWRRLEAWQGNILTVGFIIVFSMGVWMLRMGTMTPGKLMMFVGYIGLLTAPLSQLANQYRQVKIGWESFKSALEYYELEPEQDTEGAKPIRDIQGEVIFDGVSFRYEKGRRILEDVSFVARAGETVAVVGGSGAGKSTLLSLISRYYTPQKGRVLIDGVDIMATTLASLRSRIAIVPQEVMLFNASIKENIRYGNRKATDEEVFAAAAAANAHVFIEKFPKGYNQPVGERGVKLSTGQKQRLAIARAILRDPKILILDEATSALDSASEKLVQEALERLTRNRTTFVIAHRLSTIKNANKIIVFEKGTITERGTHDELMQKEGGPYRRFWELQTSANKK